jgi:hypothetical protein
MNKLHVLLIVSFCATLLGGCSCTNVVGRSVASPDGALKAVVEYRDCGATTSEYTRMILRPAEGNHKDIEQVVFLVKYRHELDVQWRDPTTLKLGCPSCNEKDIGLQMVKFNRVTVKFDFGSTNVQ